LLTLPGDSSLEKCLVVVADPRLSPSEIDRARSLAAAGARIVAWEHSAIVQDRFRSPEIASALGALQIPSVTIAEALGEGSDFAIDETVIAWMKALGRAPLGPSSASVPLRSRFRLGPLVLWWWAEIYLYHETPLRLWVRDIEALARILEEKRPDRLVLVRPVRGLRSAASRLMGQGAAVEVVGAGPASPPRALRTTLLHAIDLVKMLGTGIKALVRRRPRASAEAPVLFLTHASMWRTRRDKDSEEEDLAEMYFDRILPEVAKQAPTSAVAFGPPVPFRKRDLRSWLRDLFELGSDELPYRAVRSYFSLRLSLELAVAFGKCWTLFGELRRAEGFDEALSHRSIRLGKGARACFRDTFLRQIPWAIRSYREMEAVLDVERPRVLVLYAESSGLGRAAIAAARAHGIPSVAVQHGIMYPQYYSHEHARDEIDDGVPIPTRTAVFGELAKELLIDRGSYPPERIVVTGSPKFDALVKAAERVDRTATKRSVGLADDQRFVVLATRWSAVGPVFAELVEAVERLDAVHLLVKPHQAEPTAFYEDVVRRLAPGRTRILAGSMNLLDLLFASDGLITVDSFASSEALVLGRRVLVVNLPSNLAPLVERGVALGVPRGEPIGPVLGRLLNDPETARVLEERRREYIQEFAYGADGRSTERIVRCILEARIARIETRT
jgi:hypothetical protein